MKDRTKVAIYNMDTKRVHGATDGVFRPLTAIGYIEFTWSPDSKWMAMVLVDNNHEPFGDIQLVRTEEGKTRCTISPKVATSMAILAS